MNLNVRYLEEFVTLTEKKNFLEAAGVSFYFAVVSVKAH